jgi:hypothetical protein
MEPKGLGFIGGMWPDWLGDWIAQAGMKPGWAHAASEAKKARLLRQQQTAKGPMKWPTDRD